MTDPDQPSDPCRPVCDTSRFDPDPGLALCHSCGTLWLRRQITELDPRSYQPTAPARTVWISE